MDLISEVKAALQAATPGPWNLSPPSWHKGCSGPDCKQNIYTTSRTVAVAFGAQYREYVGENPPTAEDSTDGYLIANSPTWLQQLIDRLEVAERQREEAVKALENLNKVSADDYWIKQVIGIDTFIKAVREGSWNALKRIKGE